MTEWIFWLSLLVIGYVYVGYPVALLLLAKFKGVAAACPQPSERLGITVFIPAFNEEHIIAEKIQNALALDYPHDLLEIVVASDGSTDRTSEIIESFRNPGITVFISPENLGKNALINTYVPRTKGRLVVFTDANALFAPDALTHLAERFADPKVGCVGGKLRYLKGESSVSRGEGLYFRYENLLRRLEGLLGCMVGANGAIYALRRELFEPVPGHVPNDFFHPLVVLRKGFYATFEDRAVAFEKPTENQGEEFRRRMRIVARSIAAIPETFKIRGSYRTGAWFCLFSHKILRWLAFPVLVLNFASAAALSARPLFLTVLIGQMAFYGMGALGYITESLGVRFKAFYLPYYFLLINLAGLRGFLHWLAGKKFVRWKSASSTR